MSNDRRGPVAWLLDAAVSLLLVALLLWAALWVLERIWGWLLVLAISAAIVWLLMRLRRARRDRW